MSSANSMFPLVPGLVFKDVYTSILKFQFNFPLFILPHLILGHESEIVLAAEREP